MRLFIVFFYIGIVLLLQLRALPAIGVFPLPFFLFFLILSLYCRRPFISIVCGLLCGFLWAVLQAGFILSSKLEKAAEGQELTIEGMVVSMPEIRSRQQRFKFRTHRMYGEATEYQQFPEVVRLAWYDQKEAIIPGDHWRLTVKLKRPFGFMNPGGFDYEFWLFQQSIRASGYVLNSGKNQKQNKTAKPNIDRYRYFLLKQIQPLLESVSYGGLMQALILGDRTGITEVDWDVLKKTGTSHLIAISGLHIGLVFGFSFFLFRILCAFNIRLIKTTPVAIPAMLLALLVATGYAALAGFSIPTQRALIMLACVVFVRLLKMNIALSNILALSFFLVLLFDPFAVGSPGFYLSFLAVGIILYGMAYRTGETSVFWRWGRVQCVVVLFLTPLTILYFQSLPLIGVLANTIAIPLVSLAIVPLSLTATMTSFVSTNLAQLLFQFADLFLHSLWFFLQYLSTFPIIPINGLSPSLLNIVLAITGFLIMLLPAGMPGRYAGLIWCLPLFFGSVKRPQEGEIWFDLLDSGQGLAAVVQTQTHTLLYDTGARFGESFDAGEAVIVPYLAHEGIARLDKIVLSHGDMDHVGGLDSVLSAIPGGEILFNSEGEEERRRTSPCYQGLKWQWDDVEFQVLHPEKATQTFSGNNASCVLRILAGESSFLLTGDIEKEAELALLNQYPDKLRSNVLLVPHHGSKTSSLEPFIDAVKPEIALVASGYRNRFGFPKKVIIERYRKRGIDIRISSSSGRIRISTSKNGVFVTEYRDSNRRFWHTVP